MTHDELVALGKRAVACRGWRWMAGMATLEVPPQPPCVSIPLWDEARLLEEDRVCTGLGRVRELHPGATPDLSGPATLGCLLALVREAWGDERIHCAPALHGREPEAYRNKISHWHCFSAKWFVPPETVCAVTAWSEAGALVAALEAAP